MTEQRKAWYGVPQTIEVTPMELTLKFYEATKAICEDSGEASLRAYWDNIHPAARDRFLFALVAAICPVKESVEKHPEAV